MSSRHQGRSGFTLIEVLTVIAIVSVVAALVYPVAARAKGAARVSSAKSNLHQIWLATRLYQDNNNSAWTYGSISDMSLCPLVPVTAWDTFWEEYKIAKMKVSPCGTNNQGILGAFTGPNFMPNDGATGWENYSRKYEDESILWVDLACDYHNVPIADTAFVHRAVGVRVGGNITSTIKRGNILDYRFYH